MSVLNQPTSSDQSAALKVKNANPFLQPPVRKMHKQFHDNNNNNNFSESLSTSVGPYVKAANHGISLKYPAMTTEVQAPSRKPQRLVLTRVLASNSTVRPTTPAALDFSATSVSSSSSTEPTRTGANMFTNSTTYTEARAPQISSSQFAAPEDKTAHDHSFPSYTENTQQPSTTPKAPPSQDYYDFIRKGLSTSMSFNKRMEEEERLSEDQDMMDQDLQRNTQSKDESNQQQQQHEDQETPLEKGEELVIPPVNSSIMAFARKSIMQHASSSPQSIFRKLSNNKKASASASTVVTTNMPSTPILREKNRISESQKDIITVNSSSKSNDTVTVPSMAFTFESRPRPTSTDTMKPPSALESAVEAKSTIIKPIFADTRSAEAITANSTVGTQSQTPSIFSRSILDLSQQAEPTFPKKRAVLSNITAQATGPSSGETVAKPQQIIPIETPAFQASTPPTKSSTHVSSASDSGMAMDSTEVAAPSSNVREPVLFDLRSALRMDSARFQYQLPSLVASLSPPASPKRRPSPYTIPSANERDALRSRRTPHFKARPLNPKVFTSAGDLGVPRIPKQPLTVPVSPVFSKPRVRNAVAEGGLKKESVLNSAAALRLKNMIKAEITKKQTVVNTLNLGNPRERPQTRTVVNNMSLTQSTGTAASSALWSTPLSVPTVDKTRANINLGSIKGPPQREEVPSTSTSVHRKVVNATSTAASIAGTAARAGVKGQQQQQQRQLSKLRRPATRPVPFKFATTELQRKRMFFEPTSEDTTRFAVKPRSNSRFASSNSSGVLTLEDL
ncbi:hypothetical protein BGZ80_003452 [Entomortierella chlamydospora]|uniref:Uncharacterized protein n=1 Tax=Entomortierella chlamydospora TaxID=101097 RepID=A0A9P6MNL5_9FUNG|nr:hypothetical protein BGZ80_003452 [Entomortierella chlamydospora]